MRRCGKLVNQHERRRERIEAKILGLRAALADLRDQVPAPGYGARRVTDAEAIIKDSALHWNSSAAPEDEPELPLPKGRHAKAEAEGTARLKNP